MYLYIYFTLQSAPGLEQYAIKKFAESLEILPRAIAENAGAKVNDINLLFKLPLIFLIHV
jgi:chaperonin GroEL (HSP60 family)